MNWTELFAMQQKLDTYIIKSHQLERTDVFDKKFLALLVELGELANETRCFKFWSTKKASDETVILEEYVDNIHFILSLGLEKGFRYKSEGLAEAPKTSLTEQFHKVYAACMEFKQVVDEKNYAIVFETYLELGALLGFTEEDVQTAYKEKNEINFVRQDEGY